MLFLVFFPQGQYYLLTSYHDDKDLDILSPPLLPNQISQLFILLIKIHHNLIDSMFQVNIIMNLQAIQCCHIISYDYFSFIAFSSVKRCLVSSFVQFSVYILIFYMCTRYLNIFLIYYLCWLLYQFHVLKSLLYEPRWVVPMLGASTWINTIISLHFFCVGPLILSIKSSFFLIYSIVLVVHILQQFSENRCLCVWNSRSKIFHRKIFNPHSQLKSWLDI